jgi:hypothetical protein
MPESKVIDCMTSASEACPAADKSGMSEMIMSDLLNEKTAEWAALNPVWTGLLNKMHEILSVLLAHRLRKAEEQLMALDVVNGIGLDRSEIGRPCRWTTHRSAPTACGGSAGRIV